MIYQEAHWRKRPCVCWDDCTKVDRGETSNVISYTGGRHANDFAGAVDLKMWETTRGSSHYFRGSARHGCGADHVADTEAFAKADLVGVDGKA